MIVKEGYEDMLELPGYKSPLHLPMPMEKRAAQFAPFDALTGYREALSETGENAYSSGLRDEAYPDELIEELFLKDCREEI